MRGWRHLSLKQQPPRAAFLEEDNQGWPQTLSETLLPRLHLSSLESWPILRSSWRWCCVGCFFWASCSCLEKFGRGFERFEGGKRRTKNWKPKSCSPAFAFSSGRNNRELLAWLAMLRPSLAATEYRSGVERGDKI